MDSSEKEKLRGNRREFDEVFKIVREFGMYQFGLYMLCCTAQIPLSQMFQQSLFAFGSPMFHCDDANTTCPPSKCCDNCTTYAFDGPFTSTVSEWNLLCDRAYLGAGIQSSFFAGMLIGSLLSGWLADACGRRTCMYLSAAFMGAFSLAQSLADCMSLLMLMRFGVGFSLAGLMLTEFVYLVEMVGPGVRTHVGKTYGVFWKFGAWISVLLSYLVRDWRLMVLIGSLPIFYIFAFWRFTVSLVYFGFDLYTTQLPGSIYFNYFIMNLIDIPVLAFSWFVLYKYGRRLSYFGFMVFAGVASFIVTGLPSEYGTATTALAIIGRSLVWSQFNSIYIITGELFPTVIRNTAMGLASLFARVGAILSPFIVMVAQLPGLSITLPVTIFGVLALGSAVASLWLPETMNADMHQTINEAESAKEDFGIPCLKRREANVVELDDMRGDDVTQAEQDVNA